MSHIHSFVIHNFQRYNIKKNLSLDMENNISLKIITDKAHDASK